ncbi:hypothetical protein ACLB2K_054381 [Fragaria x ananassa]
MKMMMMKSKMKLKMKMKMRRKKRSLQYNSSPSLVGSDEFTNLHQKRIYDSSKEVRDKITTTNPIATRTTSTTKVGEEKNSMNVADVGDDVVDAAGDDEEDMVEINDDVILMGLEEYLSRRSIHHISEELRRKLESKWRQLAYERAKYDLAVSEFAIKLQHYKLRYYNNC